MMWLSLYASFKNKCIAFPDMEPVNKTHILGRPRLNHNVLRIFQIGDSAGYKKQYI